MVNQLNIEAKLAKHADKNFKTKVIRIEYASPFAIMLADSSDFQVGRHLKGYADYARTGTLPTEVVEDAMLDGNPEAPKDWKEMSERLFAYRPKDEESRKVVGEVNIIDSCRGAYFSPIRLTRALATRGMSPQEFKEVYRFDPSKKGIVPINEHTPCRERKLATLIHELVHARDFMNGLSDELFKANRKAFELLTDFRAYVMASPYLSDSFYSYMNHAEKNGHNSGYFIQSKENVLLLNKLARRKTPVNMAGFLNGLKENLRANVETRDLMLGARVFSDASKNSQDKEKEITKALDMLIDLEKDSILPQVDEISF